MSARLALGSAAFAVLLVLTALTAPAADPAPPSSPPNSLSPHSPSTRTSASAEAKSWDEILGPSQGAVPPPRTALGDLVELPTHRQVTARTRIDWEQNLSKALAAAKRENRPIFLTFRCLPCKSCSEFDKTVLEGGPDLDPLFLQFVTARVISTQNVDLRLLPMASFQDMDVSWWSWFLSPEGKVYAVFGGRDETGDQARTSKAALIATMRRVLAHHYDPRRPAWDVDGPSPVTDGPPVTPVDLPGYKTWLGTRQNAKIHAQHNCIHCHQTSEIMRQGEIDAGRFDKKRDVQPWPLPENVGVTLDRDDGLLVSAVTPASPADRAGIKPGDSLAAANDRRLFGQADFRAVLHRADLGPTKVAVRWTRGGKLSAGTLDLPESWRRTDLAWRTSVAFGNVGAFPGFWPNVVPDPVRQRLGIPADALAIKPFLGQDPSPAARAGLKSTDVITAVNGERRNLSNRDFAVWYRMRFEPGDEVTLTVTGSDGAAREVKYRPER